MVSWGVDANASVVDSWSLVHLGMGLLAGALGVNAWVFVVGAVGYEAAELVHESPSGSRLFGTKRPEWDVNMVSDIGVACAGFVLARWLSGDGPLLPRRSA